MPFKNGDSPSAVKSYGRVSIDPVIGTVNADVVNAEAVTIGGRSVTDNIAEAVASRSQGTLFLHELRTDTTYRYTAASSRILNRVYDVIPGRLYSFLSSTINFETSDHTSQEFQVITDIYCGNARAWSASNQRTFNGWYNVVAPHVVTMYARSNQMRVIIDIGAPTSRPWRTEPAFPWPSFMLVDLGPVTNVSSTPLSDYAVSAPGNPAPPTPPAPVTVTYTADFYATASANYNIRSNTRNFDEPDRLMQSSVATERAGFATFAGSKGTAGHTWEYLRNSNVQIQGATLTAGEQWAGKSVSWYYSSGGIGRLYYSPASGFGDTVPARTFITNVDKWGNSQVRSIELNNLVSQIKSGALNSIAFSGEGLSGQNTYHGYIPSRPRMTVRYSVTTG